MEDRRDDSAFFCGTQKMHKTLIYVCFKKAPVRQRTIFCFSKKSVARGNEDDSDDDYLFQIIKYMYPLHERGKLSSIPKTL